MYAQAISDGHKETVASFSTILDSVHGYDYVPETTRSTAYKKIAREFVSAHYGMNNFYNEPAYAKKLNSMGTVIPDFSLSECLQAVIVSTIGNQYGVSTEAQQYNKKILQKVTTEQWKQFVSQLLIQDQKILEKLAYGNSSMANRWFKLITEHVNVEFNIEHPLSKKVFESSKKEDPSKLKKLANHALSKIIG